MFDTNKRAKSQGFTLIEVLIALAIMSIALTAILLTIYSSIKNARQIQETNMAYLVSAEGLHIVELDQVQLKPNQETSVQQMSFFGDTWFWKARAYPTNIPQMMRVEVSASVNPRGPYKRPVTGFMRFEDDEYGQ